MIAVRLVCALAVVVGACWGDAALQPNLRQDLHHNVYNLRGNTYDDDDSYDDALSGRLYRTSSPLGFQNYRDVPTVFSHHAPAVPTYNAPGVSTFRAPSVPTFNAPAVNSLRGAVVVPNPSIVSFQTPAVLPNRASALSYPLVVHKTTQPYVAPVPQPKPVQPIKSQYHVQDGLGQYAFGYDAGTSTREETRDAYGNVRGSFSYIDSNGVLQTQHYIAGKGGFRVRGTNLPVHVTNEPRYKRSYATFPAATGPLTTPMHYSSSPSSFSYDTTPYYVYGSPRTFYSLQEFPITTYATQYYPSLQGGFYY